MRDWPDLFDETRKKDDEESDSRDETKETQVETESEDKTKPPDLTQQFGTQKIETNLDKNSGYDDEKNLSWVLSKENLTTFCKEHRCLLSDLTQLPRLSCGDFVVRVELDEPGEKLKEKAKRELRETEEVVKQSLEELKGLLREEQESRGLIAPIENEAWLLRFLRPTHFYAQSAFLKVKTYYEFKIKNDKHKELYKDLKPSTAENIFNHDIMNVLPSRDKDGCRVLVLEIGKKWNYNMCTVDDIYKGGVVFLEAAMLEPETQISGVKIIFDMEGLDNWQILHLTINPSFIFRSVELFQNAAPIRIKGFHIINEPSTYGKLLKVFTSFMNTKLKNRIHIHTRDRDSLHRHFGADCLPLEYKGTCRLPRVSGPCWLEALATMDREYEVVNSYGYKQ